MENLSSQQAKKESSGWWHKLSAFISFILILLISLFAIIVISEIAARESVLSALTGRIAILKSEFVELNRTGINILVEQTRANEFNKEKPSLPDEQSRTNKFNEEKQSYRESLLTNIEFYEELKRTLIFLIAQGSSHPTLSLNAIQRIEISNFKAIKYPDYSRLHYVQFPNFMIEASQPFLLLSSDQLLALAIMACAAIGAVIAALRGDGLMTLRALALGVATGFVVYLAIKGGKHVFLLQMQTEIVAFNPYGSAFAGLLAGMFTEKAYQLINTIVDDFADRLRAVSAGKKGSD
ncbi:MAG: hypothetical protein E6Q59_08350 [Nitrosomonas sp.]|nr:MAG: hypothetical protein E6Q59_08350 [Nitrosomonas sp.]